MAKTTITVRQAIPSDSAQVSHLYNQLVVDVGIRVLPSRIASISQDPNTALFVCELDGTVRATALVSLCSDVMYGFQPFAVLENVVVDASVRGSGVGELLLGHIEVYGQAKDCSKIMLLSSANRADAHRFFVRAGFAGSTKRGFVKYRRDFAGSSA